MNAVRGLLDVLARQILDLRPRHLVCCFDEPGKTFRDELVDDYKANRGPMPDDLQLQIPMIRQMLEAMRIPVLMQPSIPDVDQDHPEPPAILRCA